MAKTKTVYVCRECGAESPKWMGRCPKCGEWESLVEMTSLVKQPSERHISTSIVDKTDIRPVVLDDIELGEVQRTSTNNGELDRVLGGGIVPGALILIGGEPGIDRKSTRLNSSHQ